jgi:hypothetical protein
LHDPEVTMRVLAPCTPFHIRTTVIPAMLALFLAGCAAGTTPGIARSGSPCGMNALLYCDLSPHGNQCQCFRHSEFRDMMRTFSRR